MSTTVPMKVIPPAPPPAYLARPRLDGVLASILDRRVTCVVADAGFGKSTLLGAMAGRVNCAWYTVSSEDVALPTLARGIALALGTRVHGFPPEIASAAGAGPEQEGAGPPARVQALAGLMCSALRGQLTDLVLVLDDLHELPDDGPAAALVEWLCRQAPATMHVVLASRTDPPFSIDRLRRHGHLLEIGGRDLAFTPSEVEELLRRTVGPAAPDLAAEVHAVTGGWPAAVRLAAEAFDGVSAAKRAEVLRGMSAREGSVFSFLAGEVVAGARPEVRELIRAVAHLDRFTPALCQALGFEGVAETLHALYQRGLFVELRPEGAWYALNTLVAEFARERFPLPDADRRVLLSTAAEWFEANGHVALALRCALAASDEMSVARLLGQHGDRLVATGDAESVLNAVEALPDHVRDARARIAGDAHMLRGDWDAALSAFRHAGSDGEVIDAGIAWRVGSIRLGRGDPAGAIETFERALVDGTDPMQEALLFSWRAQASYMRGETDACVEQAERSLALAGQARDDLAMAAAHTASGLAAALGGDHVAETRHWHRALDHAEKVRDVQWIVRIRNHRATRRVLEDAYDEALSDIEVVLDLSEATGSGPGGALALTTRGAIRFLQGALEESLADLRSAAATFERRGSPAAAYPLRLLGDVLRVRGSLVPARAAYERALEIAEAGGSVNTLVMVLAGLAQAIVEDRPDEASAYIERAVSHESAARISYVQEAAARVALARGESEAAHTIAQWALEIAQDQGPAQRAEALELLAASGDDPAQNRTMLDEALAIWTNIGHPLGEARVELALAPLAGGSEARERAESAERAFRTLGARPLVRQAVELLAELDREALPALAITTLGGFGLERDGARVRIAEWQSRKARDLLKMLVARRGRPISRDVLIDALWPGDDPAKASNRFSVALSTVRSVLDPEKKLSADQVIVADSASAALSIEGVAVDVERFLADASRGLDLRRTARPEEAMPFLLSAEALYAGDFLEEDLYEEWAVGLREEARTVYIAVARALSEEASKNGDEDAAVRYLLRILERDQYDEHAHLELVASLERAERHGESRRRYRTYCSRMEEIGVESAPFPSRPVA